MVVQLTWTLSTTLLQSESSANAGETTGGGEAEASRHAAQGDMQTEVETPGGEMQQEITRGKAKSKPSVSNRAWLKDN